MLAEKQVDPAYSGSDPIAWPIPHMCPHGEPCHGPTLSTMRYDVPGGPCVECTQDLIERTKETLWT